VPFGRSPGQISCRRAARSDPLQDKKRPAQDDNLCRTAGYRFHCVLVFPCWSCAGEDRARSPHVFTALASVRFWLPEGLWFNLRVGAGLTDRET